MAEIDAETRKRLYQLAYQETAIVKAPKLPRIWGLTEDAAASTLAGLIDAGLVELWPERVALVLSSIAADRLGLELIADHRNRLVWHTRGTPSAERARQAAGRTRKRSREVLETDLADEANLLDALPGPTTIELQDSPAPIRIMGLGLVWHGPTTHPKKGQRCKGCGHCRKMPESSYCVLCDKSSNRNLRTPILPADTDAAEMRTSNSVKQGASAPKAPNRRAPQTGEAKAPKRPRKVAVKSAI